MVRGVVFTSNPEAGLGTESRPSRSPASPANTKSAPNNVIEKRRNKFGTTEGVPTPARFPDRGRGYRFRGRGGRGAGPGRGGRGHRGRGRPRFTNKTLIVNGGGGRGAGRPEVSKEFLDHDLDTYFNQSDNKDTVDNQSIPTEKSTD